MGVVSKALEHFFTLTFEDKADFLKCLAVKQIHVLCHISKVSMSTVPSSPTLQIYGVQSVYCVFQYSAL